MSGETNLHRLLQGMKPELNQGEFVYCTLPDNSAGTGSISAKIEALGWFHEGEGLTLILPRKAADELSLPYTFVCAWITLTIHSALEAVGLTAAVARALTEAGISCNVVAAYYHDHLFVPVEDAARALAVLQNLARNGG
jgi:uncharacterized protein